MKATGEHRISKRFVAMCVACALVAFSLFYLLLSPKEESRGQENTAATASIVAATIDGQPASATAVPPSRVEQPAPPETTAPVSSAATINEANEIQPSVDTSARSITFRATRFLEKPGAPSGSAQLGDIEQLDTHENEFVKAIEVHAELKGCDGCSSSKTRKIVIPRVCTYMSHTLTQLQREPFVPIEQARDRYSDYIDYLDPDSKGRIEVVRLIVEANKPGGSTANPSITMRLTVAVMCPIDTKPDGWSEVTPPVRPADTPARRTE